MQGAKSIVRDVDLETMPIYVRAGAILPIDPIRQYTGEKTAKPLTLRIYTGANGNFSMYEDDGFTMDYLKGNASVTEFAWDDQARRLTIKPGTQNGSQESQDRKLTVVLLPEGTKHDVVVKNGSGSFDF